MSFTPDKCEHIRLTNKRKIFQHILEDLEDSGPEFGKKQELSAATTSHYFADLI